MKRRWRRRNYFIKRDLQGRYIFSFFLFVTIGSILFALILGILSSGSFTMVYENYNLRVGKTPVILLRDFIEAHWIFLITGGLAVLITSLLTHRFAGPVFRFEKTLQNLIEGRLDFTVRLRRYDEAKEIAELFNRLIERLSDDIRKLREASEEMEAMARRLADETPPEPTRKEVEEIKRGIEKINLILKRYTLTEDD